jgi:hypothetical protein
MMKAAEWVKALRSGDYEQGQEYLCRGGRFCCLGVLCEIQGLRKEVAENDIYYVFEGLKTPSGGTRSLQRAVIPQGAQPTILEDLNLRQVVEDDEGDKRTLHTHLICMNDDGKSFNEIADYIEGVVAGNE